MSSCLVKYDRDVGMFIFLFAHGNNRLQKQYPKEQILDVNSYSTLPITEEEIDKIITGAIYEFTIEEDKFKQKWIDY